MPIYRAPLEDFRFLLHDLLAIEAHQDLPGFAELTPATTMAVLEGGARFCEEVLQPLNRSGDEEGCQFENGIVRTPKGFAEAYAAYCAGGWNALGAPEALGGAGLPPVVTTAFSEIVAAANQSFSMYPGLTNAAQAALGASGADWMKAHILPHLVSGRWTGTMCLTEAHCGTDLRLMKTRAIRHDDGSWRLSGTKIFISGGEHDMAENIVHLVLAKIPDSEGRLHDDLATVNVFVVPKMLVDPETGALIGRNGVTCGGIEHKMGIRANATCVLHFEDAVAWRLGPETPSAAESEPAAAAGPAGATASGAGEGKKRSRAAGMAGMFGMMNAARLGVGVLGIAQGEVACQNAAAYARERLAGRALDGAKAPDAPADPLIVHPDVRRLLLEGASCVEGMRALALWIALQLSVARHATDPAARQEADDMVQLMTPVLKAFGSDGGFETANAAMQIYGGHGYIRETGMEQFVRDARINQIYEGANGVQALDLVARKLPRAGGRGVLVFLQRVNETLAELAEDATPLAALRDPFAAALTRLQDATLWLAEHGRRDPNAAGAASYDYLRLMGLVAVGWMWLRMAQRAQARLGEQAENAAFHRRKLVLARFWIERRLPESAALFARITAGSAGIMALDAASF